ncbi:putative periplasmic lipoprotein [Psychrobacter jeotgali]|uniref:hypothetical protein n=1 Tax=Psychrobacter jeotgali TaxID=179010 RepID=UPI001917B702|nr:hypothetical protein [Psychrobacter jeotgali]
MIFDILRAALVSMLSASLLLAGCQPAPTPSEDSTDQQAESIDDKVAKSLSISDSALAHIEQFQPLYVEQVQNLQRRLQAEYESLKAADAADNDSLSDSAIENVPTTDTDNAVSPPGISNTTTLADEQTKTDVGSNTSSEATAVDTNESKDTEINTSTEIGERDLEVLKRISFEPKEPEILDGKQIIDSYQKATRALYQTGLPSAEETDTLLNIATLIPQFFEHPEIAERLDSKSPTLARLIVQQQIWEQIEAQQVADIQQMKQSQQAEFETLMAKFDETIKGYDEQIAKYEQQLESFQ